VTKYDRRSLGLKAAHQVLNVTFEITAHFTPRLELVHQKQAFSPFFEKKNPFISVTLSQQGFQDVHGGKMCLRYFYAWLINCCYQARDINCGLCQA